MHLIITKKNIIGILAILALASFSTLTFFNYIGEQQTSLPMQLTEKPQFLNRVNGNDFRNPMGVAIATNGRIYISDPGSHQIKLFTNRGEPDGAFGQPGTATGQLNYPYGLAINRAGNLLVADSANRRVSVFSTKGEFIKELVPANNLIGLARPGALTVDRKLIYISDLRGHQVVVIDQEGKLVRKFGSPGSDVGEFKYPQSLVVDDQHRLWVADTGNNRIQVFNEEGKFLFKIDGKGNQLNFSMLSGMAIDSLQRVFVSDAILSKIFVFDSEGKSLFSFGGLGSGDEQFRYPMNLWVAKNGNIFITDRGNKRVQVWGYKGR